MLLQIKAETPFSALFTSLNGLLIEFIQQATSSKKFSKALFPVSLREPIWSNVPTRKRFRELWGVISEMDAATKSEVVAYFQSSQDIAAIFGDKARTLQFSHAEFIGSLSRLTGHLYSRTKDLADVVAACGETALDGYSEFCRINARVCCFCATEELAQVRANIPEDWQWRGPYDHLIPKESHPIFGVHPQNLIPTCHTCNSKAKLARQLLFDGHNNRRMAFYPRTESAHPYVHLDLIPGDINFIPYFSWQAADVGVEEKLEAWNEVYEIKNRVEGKFSTFIEIMDVDCGADSFIAFKRILQVKVELFSANFRADSWVFWRLRLYESMLAKGDAFLNKIWELIQKKRDDANCRQVYGI